jgi:peptidoglycan hydrolase-like protein with peptidoglycan-binding domain
VDYAWHGPIHPAAFRAAGITFVIRYLSNDDGKNLHRREADLLSNAGLDLCVVWETFADRARAGHGAGVDDARRALAQATACGMPEGRPIYFAVDFDARNADEPLIREYLRGAATVLGTNRVGVYGGYRVVRDCFDHGVATFGWQTAAWSGGNRFQHAQLFQHAGAVTIGGVDCDRDTATARDFGQWRSTPPRVPPPPHPTGPPRFPYPPTDYLATARPDPHCHWGRDAEEQAHVATWQTKMGDRGWRVSPTGTFGRQSDRICRAFQREKGLVVDGKVGPITWAASWTARVT